jgi:alpha-tubulin suppressor-like RCC1 family protein
VTGLATSVQAIAAGGAHTCALVGGGARCWGSNGSGQLGNNSTTDSHVPVQVALSP